MKRTQSCACLWAENFRDDQWDCTWVIKTLNQLSAQKTESTEAAKTIFGVFLMNSEIDEYGNALRANHFMKLWASFL